MPFNVFIGLLKLLLAVEKRTKPIVGCFRGDPSVSSLRVSAIVVAFSILRLRREKKKTLISGFCGSCCAFLFLSDSIVNNCVYDIFCLQNSNSHRRSISFHSGDLGLDELYQSEHQIMNGLS
jgi:hypothetical protein